VVKVVRGATKTIPFRFRIPRGVHRGVHRFGLAGADPDGGDDALGTITIDLGDLGEEIDTEGPRTRRQLTRAFRGFEHYDGLRLRGSGARVYKDRTYRIGGRASAMTRVVR
jgi:hypothetical protein